MNVSFLVRSHVLCVCVCLFLFVYVFREYLKEVTRDVSMAHSLPLDVVIVVVGWIYFLAWSISFYPQVRKELDFEITT